ncbi:MAG: FadR/GntR family transcriptional regulator [Hyphomonas sp.]
MRQKIKMTEGAPVSRVSETSQRLADLSLAVEEGEHLGAETELLKQLGVSRPTLRQAAKIVEADRLITVRKGPGGGFFASRPSAADVIRAPARYLRLQGASLMDVHVVTRLIASEAASLAAACSCEEQREILKLHRDAVATTSHDDDTPETTIQQETRLARILSDMSGNPAIALFMEIGYTFGREEQNVRFYQDSDDRSRSRKLQVQLCDAILAHDADIAQVLMARRTEMIVEWITK